MATRSERACLLRLALAAALVGVASRAAPAADALTTVCGVHSPEDVEWVDPFGVLISEMAEGRPGAIALLEVGKGGVPVGEPRPLWPLHVPGVGIAPDPMLGDRECTEAVARDRWCTVPEPVTPDPKRRKPVTRDRCALTRDFAPHGIAARTIGGVVRVVAVNHGGGERIDVFDLVDDALENLPGRPVLRWRACLPMPPRTRGNDVALTPDGDVVVTNHQPRKSPCFCVAARFGERTGDLRRWRTRERRWETVPGTADRAPNGVFVADDGRIFYSASGSGLVHEAPDPSGRPPLAVEVGGVPDNLAAGPDGAILVVTHASGWGLFQCKLRPGACRSPWSLVAVDPATGRARDLLRHDGSVLGAASAATLVGGRFVFGAVFGDRVGVWNPAESATRTAKGDR